MAKRITLICHDCKDLFEEELQVFVDDPRESVLVPALCKDCGHGDND